MEVDGLPWCTIGHCGALRLVRREHERRNRKVVEAMGTMTTPGNSRIVAGVDGSAETVPALKSAETLAPGDMAGLPACCWGPSARPALNARAVRCWLCTARWLP